VKLETKHASPPVSERTVATVTPRASFFTSPTTRRLERSVRYVHSLADTPEGCAALMARDINCDQIVEFCADGTAWFLVTDIVNKGQFEFVAGTASVAFDASNKEPGLPDVIGFGVSSDESLLRDGWLGVDWAIDPTRSFSMCRE
jgi:hypothetical protein